MLAQVVTETELYALKLSKLVKIDLPQSVYKMAGLYLTQWGDAIDAVMVREAIKRMLGER